MNKTDTLRKLVRRRFRGLWLSPDFRKLWTSLTITSFGAQITNLALPLTAALLLNATPMQMGILVALETLPFALVSLHAGVLLDRVRKLPIVIMSDIGRGVALLAIPLTAWFGMLSIEILFVVGFVCGVQNVIGGAAYQVLLAQMAGRKRLVEANAKTALGETSAALIAPGIAGGLIQLLTAPFAIVLDAAAFFVSALLLRRVEAPNDVPHPGAREGVWHEIGEGLKLVVRHRTLWALAWLAGLWQFLHHMQIAVLILFATRELSLSAGAIGFAYALGGLGCVLASALAQRLSARYGVGPMVVNGMIMTAIGWQLFGLIGGPPWIATLALGARDARVRLRRDPVGHQLPGAAAGDHAGPLAWSHDRDDALLRRRVGPPRFAGGRCTGDRDRPASDVVDDWRSRSRIGSGRGNLVSGAKAQALACARPRLTSGVQIGTSVQALVMRTRIVPWLVDAGFASPARSNVTSAAPFAR